MVLYSDSEIKFFARIPLSCVSLLSMPFASVCDVDEAAAAAAGADGRGGATAVCDVRCRRCTLRGIQKDHFATGEEDKCTPRDKGAIPTVDG